jgi:4-amino-4-deoxy-L-arabinose transferase-like glycosyltransferase
MRGSRYVTRVRGLGEPVWVGVAVVAFIAVTIWWLTVDTRVPDFDSGQHLIDIFTVRAEILSGNLTAPFSDWNNYPPLGHIVGAIGTLIGGFNPASVVMANNLVFLPLLAFGCYGAGTIAGGRRAGLLAALFALGTPIVVSEMREIYLDVGEAAMVAVSVWAILATRRFERIWLSALAGLVCSIGMLSKQTFAVFIVGLIAAVIVRGGWRHWRGIAMFILGGAGLTLPWYVYHYSQLHGLTAGATAGGNAGAGANVANGITPPRWSQQNFGWYL